MMEKIELTRQIKQMGLGLGFHKIGIVTAHASSHGHHLLKWLKAGRHGDMHYMQRSVDKRLDPKLIMPEARSIIVCALNYHVRNSTADTALPEQAIVSRYARGRDYHDLMWEKLDAYIERIQRLIGNKHQMKRYCDTGPILERYYAEQAGVGWIGKNTCSINRDLGSWLFLGEILIDMELTDDSPALNHCGSCTRCLDACPTNALPAPYELDSKRCISYLTIELKGEMDPKLEPQLEKHLYGCDICQDVCPWNQKAPLSDEAFFQEERAGRYLSLSELLNLSENQFKQRFSKSPVKRAKYMGFMRNVLVVAGNSSLTALTPLIAKWQNHPELGATAHRALQRLTNG